MKLSCIFLFVLVLIAETGWSQETPVPSSFDLNNQALNQYRDHPAIALQQLERCSRLYSNRTCRKNLKDLRQEIGIGAHRAFAFGIPYGLGAKMNFLSSFMWRLISLICLGVAALLFYFRKNKKTILGMITFSLLLFVISRFVLIWERADQVYIVKEDQSQLYSSPYLTSIKEDMAYAGQLVLVLEEYEDWCQIQVEHVSQGWIEKKFLFKL